MHSFQPARREFLQLLSGSAGAAWLAANWPALVSAAEHAHAAAASANPKLEVLTEEQARELDALTSRIIPTDDVAGAHEAGVIYFIDRALKTFAKEDLPSYQKGFPEVLGRTKKLFPGVASFSAATTDQQDKILADLFAESEKGDATRRLNPDAPQSSFVELLRIHTVFGYLVDPDGGGNRDYAGWKAIGRDPAHMFSPPFGYYDRDYPGWQPSPAETEKK
ncbi:MAG TPA: gluconate 2-dehydrogenase subunit 3 family protein [Terriglobales bacterium]|nr:gluconate 2-dehydrogenase subunit 3 family protein [Terriglobales bacterium]